MPADYPPVVPGLTETDSGSETMQMLSSLVRLHQQKPKALDDMLTRLAKLFTPTEPPEPETRNMQPDPGQAPIPFPSQPMI